MAICPRCFSAIQRLRPQESRPVGDINVTLPIYGRACVRDCWICFKFFKWLESEIPNLAKKWRKRSLHVKFTAVMRLGFEQPQQDMLLPLAMDITPFNQDGHGATCQIELNFMSATEFSKNTLTASQHTTAGINLSVVDYWVETCTRDHKKCREDVEPWYPSRLLRLAPQGREAKLIVSKDSPPRGAYMTLSHRWGPQSYTMLETSTMEQLQHGIDVTSLPQIFQDTIEIAYHLDIEHLWIDALCIVQKGDNLSDWKIESQNMDKVYSCAFLNISATMSVDGSESLFKERSWGPFLPSEIELEVNGLLQKFYVLDGDIWYDEITNAPLNKRGWVFQERFLARRVLHFGERQIGWECRELDALEMFPEGLPQASVTSSMNKPKVANMMATLAQQSDQTPGLEFDELWQSLVTEYSKCKLTDSTDKLIAFAGVAKLMMRARNDRYAAGMWGKGMVYGLAWWRLIDDREAFPISKTFLRAPSWSWASVDGEINFPSTIGGVQAHFTDILESSELITNESRAFATQESIKTKGLCLPLSIECSNEGIVGLRVAGFRFSANYGPRDSTLELEVPEEELVKLAERGKVLFLPLFATAYSLHGIVLAKIRGIRAHRRLGAVQIPIMEIDVPKEIGEGGGQNSCSGQSQLGGWVTERSVDQSNPVDKSWNVAAVNLLYYLLEPSSVRRIIDIY